MRYGALQASPGITATTPMSKAWCAYSVNKQISTLPGVDADSIDVDLENGEVVFRSSEAVSQAALESIFSSSGFTLSDLEETAAATDTPTPPSMLAIDLTMRGLQPTEFEALLEAIGNLAASQPSQIVIHAATANEPDFLKPMLMGRQQVMKVKYVNEDSGAARIQLYLNPR